LFRLNCSGTPVSEDVTEIMESSCVLVNGVENRSIFRLLVA